MRKLGKKKTKKPGGNGVTEIKKEKHFEKE